MAIPAGTSAPASTFWRITPCRPRTCFRSRRAGAPWFAWEWLTDVMYALLFQVGGLKAIVLVAGVDHCEFTPPWCCATRCGAAPMRCSRRSSTLLAVGASSHALSGAAASVHFAVAAGLPLGGGSGSPGQNTRWLWALDSGDRAVDQPAWRIRRFPGCARTAGGRQRARGAVRDARAGRAVRRYAALLLGCSLASLVNPYGIQLHVHIFEYLRADWIKNLVQEFQAPTFRIRRPVPV